MHFFVSNWLRLVCVAAAFCCLPLHAQTFPTKPIRVIVPYPPGSGSDVLTRIVTGKLSERLNQPVTVDNVAGAGALIGVTQLKNAAPDGYTLGILATANSIQPSLMKNLPFDLRNDFIPLTMTYSVPLVMIVPASSPAKTVPEFVALAKANPTKFFYGNNGIGSSSHLAAEMFKQLAGIGMTGVAFKGANETVAAMLGGQIDAYLDGYTASQAVVESGRARVLAVAGKRRMSTLPNVPTFNEYFPGLEVLGWTGFAAPKGTPKNITDRLSSELIAVLNMPEIRQKLAATGVDPGGTTGEEFTAMIAADIQKWAKVVQAAGLKLD